MDWLAIGDLAFFLGLVAVVAAAAWTDLRERRIPNWLCGANLMLGLGYVSLISGGSALGSTAIHVGLALVVAMALNALGAIGAGDAKFYASMAAWLPLDHALWLLVSVSIAGLVLLVLMTATRRLRKPSKKIDKNPDLAKLPYGIAIGVGGLVAVLLS